MLGLLSLIITLLIVGAVVKSLFGLARPGGTMKGLSRIVWIVVIIVIAVSLLSGCNSGNAIGPPIALAIVYGEHANQNQFSDRAFDFIKPYVRRSVYFGEISVVLADGNPRYQNILQSDGQVALFKRDGNNKYIEGQLADQYTREVIEFLRSDATRARYSEVDLLAAIKEAERVLRDSEFEERWIIIMDTGVSTAGRINFTEFDLDTLDREHFIARLSEREGILPDLSGINFQFIGLGDVAPPQVLPDTSLPVLRDFYHELLTACGAESVHFPVSASGTIPNIYSEDPGGYPYVSIVNFTPIEISVRQNVVEGDFTSAATTDVTPEQTPPPEEIEVGELLLPDVGFVPGESVLIDHLTAAGTLRPFADSMIAHLTLNPSSNLYILATTATTTQGGPGDIKLSQDRADTLKDVLIELGVPSERLFCIGVGANVPSHHRVDEFPLGTFCSATAQANRRAVVYERHNETFIEILDFNGIVIGS